MQLFNRRNHVNLYHTTSIDTSYLYNISEKTENWWKTVCKNGDDPIIHSDPQVKIEEIQHHILQCHTFYIETWKKLHPKLEAPNQENIHNYPNYLIQ